MAADFREVLKQLKAEEQRLLVELEKIRNSIPAIEMMIGRSSSEQTLVASSGRYVGMGTREAIVHLLTTQQSKLLTTSQISDALIADGLRTNATDFSATVSTTLSQLRSNEIVERIGDRWSLLRKKVSSSFYELKRVVNGQFMFNLKAANGEIILTSELYTTRESALNGIESVKKHSQSNSQFDRRFTTSAQPFFVLKAKNGEIIGKSEIYASEAAMEKGIISVMKNGPIAQLYEIV